MSTLVKVCGLRDLPTLQEAMKAPLDIIGFVFAKSKRQVSVDEAATMIAKARAHDPQSKVQFAGVFVNPSMDELERVLSTVPLDIVQLHAEKSPELCAWLRSEKQVKVFKVFPLTTLSNTNEIERALQPYATVIDALMLDTYDPKYGGGSGKTFQWELIPHFQQWAKQVNLPLIVAGGLHADNVTALLRDYGPDGVDVSSGVETEGMKDIQKIHSFVGRVKQYGKLS